MKFECPIYIDMPRKTKKDKRYWLNLNQYYHWHFIVKNNIKQAFEREMDRKYREPEKILKLPVKIAYTVVYGSRRKIDYENIGSVISKFFADWIVNKGIIPDDSYDYLVETSIRWGGYEKGVYKCVAEIEPAEIEILQQV